MHRNLRLLGASLAASLLLVGLAGCEVPGTAGGNQQQQQDGEQQNQTSKSIHEGTISKDETWKKADGPHIIRGEVSVESDQGVTLTIEPGTEVRFEKGASLYIGYGALGYLKAQGTAEAPIIFTSAASNPSKGDWMTIYMGNGAANSVMAHCTVKYGGGASYPAITVSGENNTPSMTNCTIDESAGFGIELQDKASFKAFTGNTIKNSGSNPLSLRANAVGTLGAGNTFTGNTHQAIDVAGEYVTKSATWLNHGIPYRLQGETMVEHANATPVVKIAAGTTVEFGPGANLYVGYGANGALYAVGTEDEPITFTGVSKTPGSWAGLFFNQYAVDGIRGNTSTTVIEHAIIEYGETSSNAMVFVEESKPIFRNTTFRNGVQGSHAVKLVGSSALIPTHNDIMNPELGNTFEGFVGLEVEHPGL